MTLTLTPREQADILRRPGWHELRFIEDAGKVRVACATCQRPMWLPQSKAAAYKRCGTSCQATARAEDRARRTRPCETCGEAFTPRQVQIDNGGGRYCSQRCNVALWQAGNRPEVRAAAAETRRESIATGRVVPPRGDQKPNWKGGPAARQRRLLESGKAAAKVRKYRAANPHKIKEFSQRRKGRKLGRLPRGTIPRIGEAQRWKCAICRTGIKAGYHVDHIEPLKRGGQHVPANVQLLCETCNVRKNAKDPIDYMRSLGRLL